MDNFGFISAGGVAGGVTVIYRDFATGAALTGTTSITLINSALIPANTFAVNDEVEILARALRNTTSGTSSHYFYYNTSASLSGATLLATQTAAQSLYSINRILLIKSTTETETISESTSASQSDPGVFGVTISSFNIDWTSDVYIIQAFANAATGNSTRSRGFIIKRARL